MNRGDYMYNRYVPNESGGFSRIEIPTEPEAAFDAIETQKPAAAGCNPRKLLPAQIDTGDLLLVLILLLVLHDADRDEAPTVMLMLAAIIFG